MGVSVGIAKRRPGHVTWKVPKYVPRRGAGLDLIEVPTQDECLRRSLN